MVSITPSPQRKLRLPRTRPVRASSFLLVLLLTIAAPPLPRAAHSAEPESRADRLPEALPETTPWDLAKLREPPKWEWLDRPSPVRSLLYTGLPYEGKPTRVFAYYATPGSLAGDPGSDADLPAVVLVHGGGGTAFREWAELWARRGYAAIAMDLAGYRPREDGNPHQRDNRDRLADGGPDQSDATKFQRVDMPPGHQWPYHAVANVMLAHSLIRGFPEVDASRTAITGISWGGYLTCIVAGVDSRFKAAVPVYGCGFLQENSAWLNRFERMTPSQEQRWVTLWDPSQYLPAVRMPILFVNGTNDFAYPLDSYMKSYAAVPGTKNIRITVKMPHGHQAGWRPSEIGWFIDQHLKGSPGLPAVSAPKREGKVLRAAFESPRPLREATLHFSSGTGPVNQREWQAVPATIGEGIVHSAVPPAEASMWFFTVTDERGATVSSPVEFRQDS